MVIIYIIVAKNESHVLKCIFIIRIHIDLIITMDILNVIAFI